MLAVISLNSALRKDWKLLPQAFLKECKYIKKKVVRHIIDDLTISSDDSGDFHNSYEKYKDFREKNLRKCIF